MTRDLGRVGRGLAGRHAGRWVRGAVACLLPVVASLVASPVWGDTLSSYAECMRVYGAQTNAAAYCRRLFPDQTTASRTAGTIVRQTPNTNATAPGGSTSPATPDPGSSQTPPSTRTPPSRTPERDPIDITPQLNQLIEGLASRPRAPPRQPSDPLAVIPGILADCAVYASNPERWRRCTADGWRGAGLRGQPPLALQTPPAPPPVHEPPSVYEPPVQPEPPPVQSRPPPVTPKPPVTPPVKPAPKPAPPVVATQPEPPVAEVPPPVTPPSVTPAPSPPPPVVAAPAPPPVVQPAPQPPSMPIWAWLVALAVAAGGGFGVAKLLGRARSGPSRAPGPEAVAPVAAALPEIALVADPGVVVLTPDGAPRAGLAVSLRFDRAADADEIRLDYPSLETAP
uniref:Uncharacterized protein n=1 Tax=Caulobacter sp. (strain K31) TaxID=366602 RepID=B0SYP5_CAUSK